MLMRLLAYIPLGMAICLLATDVTLITYTSFVEPTFPFAKYLGISSISAIFFAAIVRFTIKALTSRKIAVNYDKITRTAHRLELADSRRKTSHPESVLNDNALPDVTIARAS